MNRKSVGGWASTSFVEGEKRRTDSVGFRSWRKDALPLLSDQSESV